jgi:PhoH-like ATPase
VLHDPQSVFKFEDNNLAIPVEVLEELDTIKGERSKLAELAADLL